MAEELTGFEKDILDFTDESNLDIKLKPNFYIHMAILMAQKTLTLSVVKTSITEGLLAYCIFIEHIEMLCSAADYLSPEYKNDIENFKKSAEYTTTEFKAQSAKLANKKLELLMKEIFKRTPLSQPFHDKGEKNKEIE
jgi:hypothetical protein